MTPRLSSVSLGLLLLAVPAAALAEVTPYPAFPNEKESQSYKVTVDGKPVFVHHFLTYDQFNWMDYASFSMTGKVHVEITNLVSERNVMTCAVRPLAYGIQPQISGKTISFDLDQPRYLVVFLNEEPMFYSTGLMLFAEPPEKNPPKLGDANVVNIMDYKVDNTGKTLETAKINKAIADVAARPGGGVLFFPAESTCRARSIMKSNVKLYIDAGRQLLGLDARTRITPPPPAGGGRPRRACLSSTVARTPASPGAARSTWKATRPSGTTSSPTPATARRDRRGQGERSAWQRASGATSSTTCKQHHLPGPAAAPLRLLDHDRQRHRQLLHPQHQDRQPQAAVPRRRLRLHRQHARPHRRTASP